MSENNTKENKRYCPRELLNKMSENERKIRHESFKRNLEIAKELLSNAIDNADLETSYASVSSDGAVFSISAIGNDGDSHDIVSITFRGTGRRFD